MSLWRHRDFLRLWAGQSVSVFGSQVTQLALPLTAALTLHATAFQMGLLSAAGMAPWLAFALLVGVWVDRSLRRRWILVAADLGRAAILLRSLSRPRSTFSHSASSSPSPSPPAA